MTPAYGLWLAFLGALFASAADPQDVPSSGKVLLNHPGEVRALAFSPDGKLLASGSANGSPRGGVKIWAVANHKEKLEFETGTHVMSLVWLRGGESIATTGFDAKEGFIRIWEVSTGKELRSWKAHEGMGWCIALSPDGKTLASSGQDGFIRLWDLASGKELKTLQGHAGPVRSVAFAPSGASILSAGDDQTVRTWDVASGRESWKKSTSPLQTWTVTYSPDGKTAASGGQDSSLRLWNASTGADLRRIGQIQVGNIQVGAFAPDGKTLMSIGQGDNCRLWDVASGKEKFAVARSPINRGYCSAAFTPDGRLVAVGNGDGTIRIMSAAKGE